jgi:hypothetical protein
MTIPFYQMNRKQLEAWVASNCNHCEGSGTNEEGEQCDCQNNYHLLLERANLPLRLSHLTLVDLDWSAIQPEKVRSKLQEWCCVSTVGIIQKRHRINPNWDLESEIG